jgi:hypothetical protein
LNLTFNSLHINKFDKISINAQENIVLSIGAVHINDTSSGGYQRTRF